MAPVVSKDPVVETPAPSSPDDSEEQGEATYAPRQTNDDYVAPPIRTATPPPADVEGDGDREQVTKKKESSAELYCTVRCTRRNDMWTIVCWDAFFRAMFGVGYFRLRSARGGGGVEGIR